MLIMCHVSLAVTLLSILLAAAQEAGAQPAPASDPGPLLGPAVRVALDPLAGRLGRRLQAKRTRKAAARSVKPVRAAPPTH